MAHGHVPEAAAGDIPYRQLGGSVPPILQVDTKMGQSSLVVQTAKEQLQEQVCRGALASYPALPQEVSQAAETVGASQGGVFPEDRPLEIAAARPAGETRQEKYGQLQLSERSNVDQVPLPFVNGQADTWEKTGEKRVAIAQPFASLEKRQCTMQVIFGPGSKRMRISVIFRGIGKRISPVEKDAYHKNVDVFFQENAWADQKFCMEWAQRSYRKSLMRGRRHLP